MQPPDGPTLRIRDCFPRDARLILAAIMAASLAVLFHSHRTTGFNLWEDDFNNLGYYRTGTNDCHTTDDPVAPYPAIAWKVFSHPPEDWLQQFNTSIRSLPWLGLYAAHLAADAENLEGGRASLPHYIQHYAFFAMGIPLLYLFIALLFGRTVGLLAAAFYSVNPINAGFMGWSYESCDSLGFLFAMGCLICHALMARRGPPAGRLRLLAALCYLLLIFSKESFLSLWALIAVIHLHEDWRQGRSFAPRDLLPRYAGILWPYFSMILAFWFLHRLYFGPQPHHAAHFDFSPKKLFQKWFLAPYLGLTFWGLNLKGFLFTGPFAWAAEAAFALLWLGGTALIAVLVRRGRIPLSTLCFCWLYFHAGALHLILMNPINVEFQRWLLYASPGFVLLPALAARALLEGPRTRRAGMVLVPSAYLLFLLGFANNLDAWRDEQYLESVRIPKAIRQAYPEFPRGYDVVFFTKDATHYRGESMAQRSRIIAPAGFYGHLAVQYWYPPLPEFCLTHHPGKGWDPLRPGQLQMVYRYAEDAMVFLAADSSGSTVELGRQEMAGIPRRR